MLVVINFCSKDWQHTLQNLRWMKELDGRLDFTAVLAYDDATKNEFVQQVEHAARDVFTNVESFWYPAPIKTSWPAAPNWAWQNCARYVAIKHKDPWLWLEADAIPIRKRWLHDIAAEHTRAGKPFSGHVVDGMGHLTGVAVYPPVVCAYSQAAMMVEESAWDVVLGKDIQGQIHAAHTLFQHSWTINPETGKAWNGSGEIPTFKSPHDVVRLVDTSMALFHRNKDGTLIDQLRRFYAHPEEALVPNHLNSGREPQADILSTPGPAIAEKGPESSGLEKSSDTVRLNETGVRSEPFEGKCEILIVTYSKDADWLRYCLMAIKRHASGFSGVTLCLPKADRDAFVWLNQADAGCPINVQLYDEAPHRGMVQHMAIMGSAEQMVPKGITHVLHMDADCIIKEPITPSEYFHGKNPVYVIRSYSGLYDPVAKVVSDCAQWKEPTEKQLGFETDIYSMCRHPTGFPVEFYALYRNHIERVQKRDYFAYMLTGKNSHPQNRMDFTAMGAFAHKFMRDKFKWINVDSEPAPRDKVKAYWSHGGVTPEIRKEIEGFLT